MKGRKKKRKKEGKKEKKKKRKKEKKKDRRIERNSQIFFKLKFFYFANILMSNLLMTYENAENEVRKNCRKWKTSS